MPDHSIPASPTGSKSTRIEVGRADPSSARFRMLSAVHEGYAQNLSTALSTFLRMDVQAQLTGLYTEKQQDFLGSLPRPSCLVVFRLHPIGEKVFLFMDCATVFPLLELLLGGRTESLTALAPRNLTEVEWSLLEEIVKVMVRQLGEAWELFARVEFEVDSLVSEPGLIAPADGDRPVVRLSFEFRIGDTIGGLEIGVAESFFDAAGVKRFEAQDAAPGVEEARIASLEDANVDFEVLLEGPTVVFRELASLQVDHVLRFDYPLDRPLRGLLNGELAVEGQIVNTGRKPAFRVTSLPGE